MQFALTCTCGGHMIAGIQNRLSSSRL